MNTLRLRHNAPSEPRPASSAAFTLVELLVVIALMAIMISLVVPSLGRARGMAESAGCRANLRQMGTAFAARTADHRDQLNMFTSLWHRYTNDPRHLNHYGVSLTLHMLSYIVDIPEGSPPNAGGVTPEDWPYWRGNLVSFATCPTMHRVQLSDCIISSTYAMNRLAGMPLDSDNWTMDQRVPTMSHVQHPGDMLMFSDGVPTSRDHYVDNAWWHNKRMHRSYFLHQEYNSQALNEAPIFQLGYFPPYVHGGGPQANHHANLVYMDGRVGSYTKSELEPLSLHYWQTAEQERFWRGRTSPSY